MFSPGPWFALNVSLIHTPDPSTVAAQCRVKRTVTHCNRTAPLAAGTAHASERGGSEDIVVGGTLS